MTRILDHNVTTESVYTVEKGYHMHSKEYTEVYSEIQRAKRLDRKPPPSVDEPPVPWLKVHDLYTAPLFAGVTAWKELAKEIRRENPEKKRFVILSGTHMDQLGQVHKSDGTMSAEYAQGTKEEQVRAHRARTLAPPNGFYKGDLDTAKTLLREEQDLEIEVRNIWHPDLGPPSTGVLRAEIKEIIASGATCIVPACFSTDMFMPPREKNPDSSEEYTAHARKLIKERSIPIEAFVKEHFGKIDDFKAPSSSDEA